MHGHGGHQFLDEGVASPTLLFKLGTLNAVDQLDQSHGGQPNFGIAPRLPHLREDPRNATPSPFGGNNGACVDD
jgi:hypothetical protein